jgi:Leucine-rich repeat (LRR) protein
MEPIPATSALFGSLPSKTLSISVLRIYTSKVLKSRAFKSSQNYAHFKPFLSIDQLEPLTQLQSLGYRLRENRYPLSGTFESIQNLTNLTALELHCGTNLTHHISRLTNLTELRLPQISLGDDKIVSLQDLTKIRTLNLGDCAMTNRGWGYLTQLTNLVKLDIRSNPKIDDFGLRRLRFFPLLEEVNVANCSLMTGKGLDQITNLVHLSTFFASGTSLRSKYFKYLALLPSLTEVDVSNTLISDHALVYLKEMRLEKIRLYDCPKVSRKGSSYTKDMLKFEWEVEEEERSLDSPR